jgi:hypothetical protein
MHYRAIEDFKEAPKCENSNDIQAVGYKMIQSITLL